MSKLKDIQEMIWKAAIANKDNPLGYKLLDGHVQQIKDLILELIESTYEFNTHNESTSYLQATDPKYRTRAEMRAELRKKVEEF